MAAQTLCFLVIACLPASDGPKEKRDKAALQGEWKVVRLVEEGQLAPADAAAKAKIIFKEDTFLTQEGDDPKPNEHHYRLNARKSPKEIDVVPSAGPHKDKVFLGIYRVDGDKLRICVAFPGGERPTKFESKPKSDAVLIVLERVKP
jgi:uncharacterized protein (TIGR03067 family)